MEHALQHLSEIFVSDKYTCKHRLGTWKCTDYVQWVRRGDLVRFRVYLEEINTPTTSYPVKRLWALIAHRDYKHQSKRPLNRHQQQTHYLETAKFWQTLGTKAEIADTEIAVLTNMATKQQPHPHTSPSNAGWDEPWNLNQLPTNTYGKSWSWCNIPMVWNGWQHRKIPVSYSRKVIS